MITTLLKKENVLPNILQWLSLIGGVTYFAWVIYFNEVPFDDGDGLQHFAIAQESWNNPSFFIDHWGKPLFTFFSSPFAQFGFKAFTCFNVLVYVMSVILLLNLFRKFDTPSFIRVLSPLILISIPDYSYGVVAGMTEPFFGLILLYLFWLAVNEKWIFFVLLTSLTPFARSEGMLVVILAIPYLLLLRKWKLIPLLLVGFLFYAIVGMILSQQPLWYFENNPYAAESVYGSGPWYTYILSVFDYLGLIPIILIPIGFFGVFVWKNQSTPKTYLHVLFFVGIYFGMIVIHAYLWTFGLRGSLGLSRLATLGLPVFFAIELIAVGYVMKELHFLAHAFMTGIIGFLIGKEIHELELPTKANAYQRTLKIASVYLSAHSNDVGTIYYFHPMLAYYLGKTTKQTDSQYQQLFVDLKDNTQHLFKTGDLLVRDSKFGPIEQGLPFDELAKYPWLVPVKSIYSEEFYKELNGESKSVIIYQVFDPKTFDARKIEDLLHHQIIGFHQAPAVATFETGIEFQNLDTLFKLPKLIGPRQTLCVEIQLAKQENSPVYLIFDNGKGTYVSQPIESTTKEVILPFLTGNTTGKLFLHNPSKTPCTVKWQLKEWEQTKEPGIQRLG